MKSKINNNLFRKDFNSPASIIKYLIKIKGKRWN